MKKIFAVLLCLSCTMLFAQNMTTWFSAGDLGVYYYTGNDAVDTPLNVTVDIVEVGLTPYYVPLTMVISPFHLDMIAGVPESRMDEFNFSTFLNVRMAFNITSEIDSLSLSPYASINWGDPADIMRYRAEAGVELCVYDDSRITYDLDYRLKYLTLNAAFGLRNNVLYFKAGGKLDLATLLLLCLLD